MAHRSTTSARDHELIKLFKRIDELGEKSSVMPFDIFNIARGFADLPNTGNTIEQTKVTLPAHHNPFVRQVFYIMLRFMGKVDLARGELGELLLHGMN
ncbi:MAG TPA: hypothetical protein VKB71_12860, partial [Rhizomicrobium sp.]|nr:hypothetical protein [Rhizomicrobium sp.]